MTSKVKVSASSKLGAHSPAHTGPANDADRALASIKAWNQQLVARGNRLVEIAMREREAEALAVRNPAVGSLKTRGHPDRRI